MTYEDVYFDEIRSLINKCLYDDIDEESYRNYLKLKEMNRLYLEQYSNNENGLTINQKTLFEIVVLALYADHPPINKAGPNEFVKFLKHDVDMIDFCKLILNKNKFNFQKETLEIIEKSMNMLD